MGTTTLLSPGSQQQQQQQQQQTTTANNSNSSNNASGTSTVTITQSNNGELQISTVENNASGSNNQSNNQSANAQQQQQQQQQQQLQNVSQQITIAGTLVNFMNCQTELDIFKMFAQDCQEVVISLRWFRLRVFQGWQECRLDQIYCKLFPFRIFQDLEMFKWYQRQASRPLLASRLCQRYPNSLSRFFHLEPK